MLVVLDMLVVVGVLSVVVLDVESVLVEEVVVSEFAITTVKRELSLSTVSRDSCRNSMVSFAATVRSKL